MLSKRIDLDRTLVLGVDVASVEHEGFLRGPRGQAVGPFRFSNDRSGFELLRSKVVEGVGARGASEVVLALEPTGSYGEALARWARRQDWRVVGVLGAHTSRANELWGNSPLKSDGKAAEVICDLAVEGKWVTFSLREGPYAELKALGVYRDQLVQEQTRQKNQVRALLHVLFPEFAAVMSPFTKSGLRLLERYPTPASYGETDTVALGEQLRRWSRGRLREERAEEVLEAASESVGVRAGETERVWQLRGKLRRLRELKSEIEAVEARMARWLQDIPYAGYLLTMPGVGVVTVATLLGECGDLRDYPSARELLKFPGLNLVSSSSGKRRGRNRISKRGSRRVRHQLYLLAGRLAKRGAVWRGS
jgi:transposase